MERYLVILEVEYQGYVIGTCDNLIIAGLKSDELFNLADQYPFNEQERIIDHLEDCTSYSIGKNAEYCGRCKECTSNGILSVYIIDMKVRKFSLQQFMSERQNTSYEIGSYKETIAEFMVSNN
ncbi:MAG: hypothetical protein K8R35_00255 [Bacteroidales bacterium]|nr:hypothetical protein [Bacteroidales bacterium]